MKSCSRFVLIAHITDYVVNNCSVSAAYYTANIDLARNVIEMMNEKKIVNWLDYATILAQMRGHKGAAKHDHDVDIR